MSSVSSGNNEQGASRPSKPRGPYTARGHSCSNCRRRKIKCDGKRPTCSQCMRSSGSGSAAEYTVCEYTTTNQSEIQALEANIKVLQNRIRELEVVQEVDAAAVILHQPYADLPAPPHSSESEAPGAIEIGLSQEIDETMSQPFLDIFIRYARALGFFLHIPRFRDSMLLPKGSPGRPSEGLLSTIFLLGFHLSGLNEENARQREQTYISRALLDVSRILSSPHRDRIVQAIQAEILLAGFFFCTGRILEGKYHLHGALSITIAAKLHKLRSQNMESSSPGIATSGILSDISQLDVPLDQIDEGERINAFWTTFTMSNCWAIAADSPQNFIVESFGPTVDTPWPLDMAAYEQGLLPFDLLGRETVTRFLERRSTSMFGDNSLIAMYAKSSILLVCAATLSAVHRTALIFDSDMWQQRAEVFSTQFTTLDDLLSSFNSSLIPLSDIDPSSEDFSFAFATHLTAKVAIITLHSKLRETSSESAEKAQLAAEACADSIANNISSASTAHINPLFSSLWMTVGHVLIEEFRRVRSERQYRGITQVPGREEALDIKLQQVLITMRYTPAHSLLNDYMSSKLQELYNGL
ncbi:Zn(2)-Cys(6) binuclear cluster domain-containing protein [Lentinula aciculospora]|uniref:Zn(2)-Cys(6) binuclear cluster domain-containing protein n=1 Tax=Lentinula aciculospora TaxID=153920 RepID=A0A9W8ZX04_9AGAR|nr:Zn(2)-Cys(6) binuclear cluster domain-containing protein [Lentinula aciculospora]